MKYTKVCLTIIFAALFCSCNMEELLTSSYYSNDDNKYNLDIVFNYYHVVGGNPEKEMAAKFLIENMPAHYSYADSAINEYYDYASAIIADKSLTPEQQRDSLLVITDLKYRNLPLNRVPDARIINPMILIKTIDKSYNQWQTCPWAKHLTFEEYLEWLLPYKATEFQAFDSWRDTLLAYFGTGLENPVKNDVEYNTVQGVADMIRTEALNKLNRHGLYTKAGLPLLNAHLLAHQTYGDIPDYAVTAVLAFRAAGVPAVLDETPVGSRYTAATKWYVILNERGEELTSEWDLATYIGGAFFPDERGPKVYRNTYAIDKRRQRYRWESNKYPFDLAKKDVTSKYFLTSDIKLTISRAMLKKVMDRYVYIASAVRDEDNPWQIVDFGRLNGRKVTFYNMGREVLYNVMGYDGEGFIPISDPFILHKDGSMETISADTINSINLDKWKNNAL